MEKWKVLIADDEWIIRDGIISSVDWAAFNMEMVAEAEDGEEALELAVDHQVDVVLIDLNMPIMDGITAMKKIKQVMGRTPSDEEQTDFSDEKENLFDWKKWRKENQEKVAEAFRKMTKRKPKFEQLKTEEKVRYLYRYLAEDVKKQDRWQASLTAHEVIALTRKELQLQRLKRWYDDIRYGKQTLPEEMDAEINQLWQEFQEEK